MQKYVMELQPTDVLFGRGSGPNDHEGNVRFRHYVAERKAQYMATNHRLTKTRIAREIVDLVHAANGRFLKKIEGKEQLAELGLSECSDCYEMVDDDTIMEKAKQALRQNAAKVRGELDGANPSAVSATSGGGSLMPESHLLPQQQQQSQHQSQQVQPYSQSSLSISSLCDLDPLPLVHSSGSFPFSMTSVSSGSLLMNQSRPALSTTNSQSQMMGPSPQSQMMGPPQPQMMGPGTGTFPSTSGWNTMGAAPAMVSMPNSLPVSQQQRQNSGDFGLPGGPQHGAQQFSGMAQALQHQQQQLQHQQQLQPQQHLQQQHPQQQQQQRSRFASNLSNSITLQAPVLPQQPTHGVHFQEQEVHLHRPTVLPNRSMDSNNFSISDLNTNESDDTFDSRRTSMTMGDLMKIHLRDHSHRAGHHRMHHRGMATGGSSAFGASNVDDLRDSFSQMRTGGTTSQESRMQASSETMGTIEPMGSVTDMSLGTMGSSIFSVFRGGDGLGVLDEDAPLDDAGSPPSNRTPSSKATSSQSSRNAYESTTSLSFSDALFDNNMRKSSSLSASVNGILSDVRRQVESEYPSANSMNPYPHTVGIMEEEGSESAMGESSMSILKSAFTIEEQEGSTEAEQETEGKQTDAEKSDSNRADNSK
jgi:hypothetical protein